MTDDKDFKRLVRARMAKTGESYTTARAHLRPRGDTNHRANPATVAVLREQTYTRAGIDGLGSHLEARYRIDVAAATELDAGVFHVVRRDGPDWVARVFPAARPIEAIEGDAEILRYLAAQSFPAERCAQAEPVSVLQGQGVLVTEHVAGPNARVSPSIYTLHRLGDLLGRLHTLPADTGAMARDAGSWHHLSPHGGGRREDIAVLHGLLADAERRAPASERRLYASVSEELDGLDDGRDLPHAFIHPQLSEADVVLASAGPVIIDWTGAGRGPRLSSLATLIAGGLHPNPGMPPKRDLRLVDAIVAGYRRHVRLGEDELSRLAPAMEVFALIIDCWYHLFDEVPLSVITSTWPGRRALHEAAAERAREAFTADEAVLARWDPEHAPASRRAPHEGQGTLW